MLFPITPGTRAAARRMLLQHAIDSIGTPTWPGSVCAAAAQAAQPGAAAAITLRSGATSGSEYQLGVTESWARQLEDLQYTTGEGPGIAAFRSGTPALVPALSAEEARWPGFTRATAALGLAAAFAFPLLVPGGPVGTLTVCPGRPAHPGRALIPLARPADRAYSGDMKVSFTCVAARAIGSPVAAA